MVDPTAPRMVMKGTAPIAAGVICGGCQRDVALGHAPGCPELMVGRSIFAGHEGLTCNECGRPEGRGHDADCNVVLERFGFTVDD